MPKHTKKAKEQKPSDDKKCIVLNCTNHRGQGKFFGLLCAPCHGFITTGVGRYSQDYRNALGTTLGGMTECLVNEVSFRLDPTKTVSFSVAPR
jgi:hypothetical protein